MLMRNIITSKPVLRTHLLLTGFLFIFICVYSGITQGSPLHSSYPKNNSGGINENNTDNPVCIYTHEDSIIFEQIMETAKESRWDTLSKEQLILNVATFFLGTEYKAGTLENKDEEVLVVNLRSLDCTTYVENVIAISQIIAGKNFSFDEYLDRLTLLRYREGKINRFPSRLHYFSDWLYENARKYLIEIIRFPAIDLLMDKEINFMSEHTGSYEKLSDPDFAKEIKKQEVNINKRDLYYIPEVQISLAGREIKSGDLIAITTSIEVLDIMHTGIAIKIEGTIHLIHASSVSGKVIISDESLHTQVNNNNLMTGIIVARIIF